MDMFMKDQPENMCLLFRSWANDTQFNKPPYLLKIINNPTNIMAKKTMFYPTTLMGGSTQ
jgi:hypothetical protein